MSADLPYLTDEFETSVPNLFIAGELGGLALIKNAVNQGKQCIDVIARRLADHPQRAQGVFDVLIVGAGPAGITASLRAVERQLTYVTIEAEEIGGTVSKYPRQKLVMTSPVQFPLHAPMKKAELSKESLLEFLKSTTNRPDFHLYTNERVERVRRDKDGTFTITTQRVTYRARAVVLAMGRAGTPRKLGIPGEQLPKVMYRLIEADHYKSKDILIVGGGDSAVEAAIGLTLQKGNRVTLSYRKDAFQRIKQRNTKRLEEIKRSGRLDVIFNSQPVEFTETSAILDIRGERFTLPNDYVWIFAGGVAPDEFLKSAGVHYGPIDLTVDAGKAALEAALNAGAASSEPTLICPRT